MTVQPTGVGTLLRITAGPYTLTGALERQRAPQTCAAFERALPFHSRLIHARWSGESAWIPLGDLDFGVGHENSTSHPAPGEVLLFPYGAALFASKVGQLAGNHFLTIVEGREHLRPLGELVLWEGAKEIVFEAIEG
jgi:hypothetical protein